MKRYSRNLLKITVFIGGPILTFFIFMLPWAVSGLAEVISVPPYIQYLGYIGLYGGIIAFLFAMYQSIKFLFYANKEQVFSQASINTLKNIKYSTITLSILYVINMPLLYIMADKDDAPGILLFGLIIFSVSTVTAICAGVVEKRRYED